MDAEAAMSMGLSVERQQKTLENCSTKIERWNAPQAARPVQGASGARGGNRASVGALFFLGVGGNARAEAPPTQAGEMAWFPDWELRKAWVERNGLPVVIDEARVTPDGFVALYPRGDEALLSRSDLSRGWELHVSVGHSSDHPAGVAELLCGAINATWADRNHVLQGRCKGPQGQ